jgi:hypothetical protein
MVPGRGRASDASRTGPAPAAPGADEGTYQAYAEARARAR